MSRSWSRITAWVTMIAGVVMSAAALGSILSASRLGKLADRIGHWPVIAARWRGRPAADPAGLRHRSWQLIILRFLMGVALGGLLPCISS
jgi:MFS family permease